VTTAFSILIDALAYGMVLFIITIGLSVMMGLMRVTNLAHGAFAMIGGYLAAYFTGGLGWTFAAALAVAVAATVAIAMPLERLLYRRIYTLPDPLMQLLMTIGITFCIIGLTNYLFGPTLKTIPLPDLLRGPVDIGPRTVPAHRIFVIASGFAVFAVLWFLPLEPYYALRYMVVFLVVVSVGGAGSIGGALAASLTLGLIDTIGRYFVPDFGAFFFYLAVIVIVVLLPHGIFGRAHT